MLDSKKEIGRKIWDYFSKGYTYGQIAKKLKISKSVVSNIINYSQPTKTWCDKNLKKIKEDYEKQIQKEKQKRQELEKELEQEHIEEIKNCIKFTILISIVTVFSVFLVFLVFFWTFAYLKGKSIVYYIALYITTRTFFVKSLIFITIIICIGFVSYFITRKIIGQLANV